MKITCTVRNGMKTSFHFSESHLDSVFWYWRLQKRSKSAASFSKTSINACADFLSTKRELCRNKLKKNTTINKNLEKINVLKYSKQVYKYFKRMIRFIDFSSLTFHYGFWCPKKYLKFFVGWTLIAHFETSY